MKVKTLCDMASIKVYSKEMSAFFSNGVGDGMNVVEIFKKPNRNRRGDGEFLGHFTSKTGEVHLSGYDCSDEPIYTFSKGRWFVTLMKPAHFRIEWVDDSTDA